MSSLPQDLVCDVPRRPKIADADASAVALAIAGGLLAGPVGALIGGVAGSVYANKRQPLEMAVRGYFAGAGLDLLFYYPFPRGIKVSFRTDASIYWTLESVLPDSLLALPPEDQLDWIYGNLIYVQLPNALSQIKLAS